MTCPKCNGKTGVAESRRVELNVYRRRVCKECGYKFYTEETELEDNTGLKYYWAQSRHEARHRYTDKTQINTQIKC